MEAGEDGVSDSEVPEISNSTVPRRTARGLSESGLSERHVVKLDFVESLRPGVS